MCGFIVRIALQGKAAAARVLDVGKDLALVQLHLAGEGPLLPEGVCIRFMVCLFIVLVDYLGLALDHLFLVL